MSAPKRVAHVLGRSGGGIRRHVRYLAEHPPDGFATAGVWGPAGLAGYFSSAAFTARSPRSSSVPRGVDVVHVHGLTAAVPILFGPGRRTPVVLTVHTDIATQGRTARSGVLRALARAAVRRADAVIAVSDRVARSLAGAGVRVIAPASEPLPAPVRSRADVRRETGTPDDSVVVVTVARLHPDKGLDALVDAVVASGATGWVCGDGPGRAVLEARTAGTSVRLLGYRDDVSEVLHASDVFALPSVGEAYGIAVVEALQAGLPVIGTDTGAIPELVGDAGIVVPPGDAGALAEAVRTVVADAALRARLAERARSRRRPSPGELVARVGAVYTEVLR